jgi:ABC-type cobalamin transport system ATPase subunit
VFSHVLVLKAGGVLAAGEKSNALTPGLLVRAFDARMRLLESEGRYTMKVATKRSVVI